ncbi:MAG: YfhO family protein [Clostridium sp.]|nr:MAG: YfhO family protein [Clostridium sp.]
MGGLVVLFISFYIGQIDFIWHAFHVPNDLPFRYSFVYSFLFVIIAAYGLRSIKDIKPRYLIATAVMMGLSLLLFIFI